MRGHFFSRSVMVMSGLVPALLWAAPKPEDSYLVHPSTQTVQRREAVLALGGSKDSQAVSKLVSALSDKDPMTRMLAAQGLGTLKAASTQAALARSLATDTDAEVRQAAAVSLRQIEDPAAVDALGKALKDSSPNVRVTALAGLAHYKVAGSGPLVEALCKDNAVEVRRTAVFVLGRLEDHAAVPTLEGLLKSDPDGAVRAGAAQALGDLRAAESKEALRPLLKDPVKIVQASAARSLTILGDNSGFEIAKTLAQDSDLGVSIIAIDALGWSKDPGAEAELQTLLTQASENIRPAIQAALARQKQIRKQ